MTQWVEVPSGGAQQLAARLSEALRAAARDGSTALVLDGASGALDLPTSDGQVGWERTTWAPMLRRLRSAPTAVLVLARGHVSGLGLALCLSADICVCEKDATFAAGGTGALGGGLAWHLRRLGGARLAARLLLAGQRLDAAQAAQVGIVTETARASEAHQVIDALLTPMLQDGLAKLLLRSYRHAEHLELDESIDYDTRLAEVAHSTD